MIVLIGLLFEINDTNKVSVEGLELTSVVVRTSVVFMISVGFTICLKPLNYQGFLNKPGHT